MNYTENQLDTRNMACPMPLLKLKQALNKMLVGESLHLIATDPTSKRDFTSFIEMTNHQMHFEQINNEIHFYVIKGSTERGFI